MDELTLIRINEIKRVWEPGLSTSQLAARCDKKIWGGLKSPTRQSIIGYYHRYKEKYLKDYPLVAGNNPAKRQTQTHAKNAEKIIARIESKGPPKKIGRPPGSVNGLKPPRGEAPLPVASRLDPDFAARQERRFRLEQMMLDREPYWKERKASLLRGGK